MIKHVTKAVGARGELFDTEYEALLSFMYAEVQAVFNDAHERGTLVGNWREIRDGLNKIVDVEKPSK